MIVISPCIYKMPERERNKRTAAIDRRPLLCSNWSGRWRIEFCRRANMVSSLQTTTSDSCCSSRNVFLPSLSLLVGQSASIYKWPSTAVSSNRLVDGSHTISQKKKEIKRRISPRRAPYQIPVSSIRIRKRAEKLEQKRSRWIGGSFH